MEQEKPSSLRTVVKEEVLGDGVKKELFEPVDVKSDSTYVSAATVVTPEMFPNIKSNLELAWCDFYNWVVKSMRDADDHVSEEFSRVVDLGGGASAQKVTPDQARAKQDLVKHLTYYVPEL